MELKINVLMELPNETEFNRGLYPVCSENEKHVCNKIMFTRFMIFFSNCYENCTFFSENTPLCYS